MEVLSLHSLDARSLYLPCYDMLHSSIRDSKCPDLIEAKMLKNRVKVTPDTKRLSLCSVEPKTTSAIVTWEEVNWTVFHLSPLLSDFSSFTMWMTSLIPLVQCHKQANLLLLSFAASTCICYLLCVAC